MKDINESFNIIFKEFYTYEVEDKLKNISNLIFNVYPDLYKSDVLWNK